MAIFDGVEMDCKLLVGRRTLRNLLYVRSYMEHLFKYSREQVVGTWKCNSFREHNLFDNLINIQYAHDV